MALTPTRATKLALTSPILQKHGFFHGFSQRSAASPSEQEGALAAQLGVATGALYQVNQVHGARVLRAGGDARAMRAEEADALVATAPYAVGVRVADCVPVLVAHHGSGAVAAIHAGWRGLTAGIVRAAVGEIVGVASRGSSTGGCVDVLKTFTDVSAHLTLIDRALELAGAVSITAKR